jgi:hypothetical protein
VKVFNDRISENSQSRFSRTLQLEYTSLRRKFMQTKKTPWPESASELYRPSDRRLSAKLVPTFAHGGVQSLCKRKYLKIVNLKLVVN